MIISQRVTGGTTATALNGWNTNALRAGKHVEVYNPSLVTVYIGGSNVNTSNGRELLAGKTLDVDLDYGEVLYACVALASASVNVFEQGA